MIDARPIPIDWRPEMSVYATERFLASVGDEYGWLGGIDREDRLRCILPYTIVHKAILRLARFRVETIPVGRDLSIDEERAFLNSAMRHLRDRGAHMVVPASTNTIFRTYPDGAQAAPYGTFVIDLVRSREAVWGGVSSSHRRKVRQATAAGVEIHDAADLRSVHALVGETFGRSDLPFMGFEPFARMLDGLGENVRVLVAEHDGVIQGCAVYPFSAHSAYYVYGGSVPQPQTGAMHLLHWEAISSFQELGVGRYDFVGARIEPEPGSKQEGILTFKQRFGGELLRGYMWKCSFRRLHAALYTAAARFRSGGDIVDQERGRLAVADRSSA